MSEKKTKEEDGEEHTITSSELERVITDRDYAFLKTRCGGPHALAEKLLNPIQNPDSRECNGPRRLKVEKDRKEK